MKNGFTGQATGAAPRLRFDKVVNRLTERLRSTLTEALPARTTVVLTITAPVHLPSKTAAALEQKIRTLLKPESPPQDPQATIHGNRVRIRLLKGATGLIVFVHNPDCDPLPLFDMTSEWLGIINAEAGRKPPKPAANEPLLVTSARGISSLEVYRYLCSQLPMPTGHSKIRMLFREGQVGELTPLKSC